VYGGIGGDIWYMMVPVEVPEVTREATIVLTFWHTVWHFSGSGGGSGSGSGSGRTRGSRRRAHGVEAAPGNEGKGLGQKSDDRDAIPLCWGDHTAYWHAYHRMGNESKWAAHHGLDLVAIRKRLREQYEKSTDGGKTA